MCSCTFFADVSKKRSKKQKKQKRQMTFEFGWWPSLQLPTEWLCLFFGFLCTHTLERWRRWSHHMNCVGYLFCPPQSFIHSCIFFCLWLFFYCYYYFLFVPEVHFWVSEVSPTRWSGDFSSGVKTSRFPSSLFLPQRKTAFWALCVWVSEWVSDVCKVICGGYLWFL